MTATILLTWKTGLLLFDHADGTSHAEVVAAEDPRQVAEVAYRVLDEKGWLADRLIFGIDSSKVFFLQRELDQHLAAQQEALCYELESGLPIDAESMAVVSVGDANDMNSLLAWDTTGVPEFIDCLREEYGLTPFAYVPVELCIAGRCEGSKNGQTVSIQNGDRYSRFAWTDGRLSDWSYFPSDAGMNDEESLLLISAEERKQLLTGFLGESDRTIRNLDGEFSEVVPFANQKVGSIWEPILLGSLVLLMGLFGALLWKSFEADDRARSYENEAIAQFRALNPDRKITSPVDRMLENELQQKEKLIALADHPNTSSRLLTNLEKVLAGFDKKVRFQVTSISIQPQSATIAGNVKAFEDFQTLKENFASSGFDVGVESFFRDAVFNITLAPKAATTGGGQ